MTSKTDRVDPADLVVDMITQHIDELDDAAVAELVASYSETPSEMIRSARAGIYRAQKHIAQQRRDALKLKMLSATASARPDVSVYSRRELEAILLTHVANDTASATMAARNESGEMSEDELRSVVADILSLRQSE